MHWELAGGTEKDLLPSTLPTGATSNSSLLRWSFISYNWELYALGSLATSTVTVSGVDCAAVWGHSCFPKHRTLQKSTHRRPQSLVLSSHRIVSTLLRGSNWALTVFLSSSALDSVQEPTALAMFLPTETSQ